MSVSLIAVLAFLTGCAAGGFAVWRYCVSLSVGAAYNRAIRSALKDARRPKRIVVDYVG